MNIKRMTTALIICLIIGFMHVSGVSAQEIRSKSEGNFLFNPVKLKENDFSFSINAGLPLPNLGVRTSFPLGKVDGHLFYYYYLGGFQFVRPEIDFLFTERFKLTADFVLSDVPFLTTDLSVAPQQFNLVASGIVAQISSFSADNCFSGHIGYYKANTSIPNTKVSDLIYIGLVIEDKESLGRNGTYHKAGVYMPVGSEQKLVYPSYTFGYVFY